MGRSYEERIADLDAQIARLRAKRQAAVARFSEEERRARTHALCVMGGMIEACFEGGWKAVDWAGLSSLIEGNRDALAAKTAAALPTQEASRRLRDWERSVREGGAGYGRDGNDEG